MSLFSKTEISEEIIPFIENGEGVGIVKVNGYGKASARMESYKIIFDSYEGKSPIIESVSAITYLSYKKGNFLNEPKLEIGISHKKYILGGVDNNDAELETFYKTILDIKNLEKEQKTSSYVGIKKSSVEEESNNIPQVSNEVVENDEIDLEQEILDENTDKEVIEESPKEDINDSTEDLEKIIEEDEEEFEVLDQQSKESETPEKTPEEQNDVPSDNTETPDNEAIESSDEIIFEDQDEEEFEEIFIESDESFADNFDEDNLFSDEPIIEDFDEDFEDFDDELTDKDRDSGRIIKESDETTQPDKNEDEVLVEDDIFEEAEPSEEEIIEEVSAEEEVIEEVSAEEEAIEEEVVQENIPQENALISNEKEVSDVKENIIDDKIQQTSALDDTEITAENVTSEIGKMKQRLYGGINNIQNELNDNQNSYSAGVNMQFDPVDQIRRYHELKEDGIITEEEFELKKKQLLNL